MANAAIVIGTYRRAYSGLSVTERESLMNAPVAPSNIGALTMEQLEAITDWTRLNKAALERGLIAARRLAPPATAPGAAPGTPLGPKEIRVRDKKTGRTGRYTTYPGEALPPGLEEILPQ